MRPLSLNAYKVFQKRRRLLRSKLVKKFAYNMMRRGGIDRDVAEFISGRKLEGIGAKHYTELIMLAEEQYLRYATYLKGCSGKKPTIMRNILEKNLEIKTIGV